MAPLLDRVAKKYPELIRDAALGRIGKENFVKYFKAQPLDYAWMVIRKIQNMWDRGSSPVMSPQFWFAYHKVLVFWGLAALIGLAWRRRWEALPIGLTILGITLVGGLLLAVPRRALPLMPFVLALAGVDDRVGVRGGCRLAGGYRAARAMELRPQTPRPRPRGRPDRLRRLAPLARCATATCCCSSRRRSCCCWSRRPTCWTPCSASSPSSAATAGGSSASPCSRSSCCSSSRCARWCRTGGSSASCRRRSRASRGRSSAPPGCPSASATAIAVVIPAYNEEDNIGSVLPRIPETVCGVETAVLVVDDGSRDRTGDVAREHGAAVARHVTNLGGGAALRTGYRLMSDSGARGRRDAGRRRPAPARGDVAARAARARRRGRHGPRLARARPRRGQPLRARDGDHLLQPARLASSRAPRSRTAPTATAPCARPCSPRSCCARSSSTRRSS